MRSMTFLAFVVLTFICWGVYGPVLHVGQEQMGADGKLSSLRPLICVGLAYFLIAVVFPLVVLMTKGEKGNWSPNGFFWSFFAGAVGAIGALGIILAFKFNGKPFYVMPLVFGCAPVVNTFVSMLMAKTIGNASKLFYVGVLLVAVGAAGVLVFKPTAVRPKIDPSGDTVKTVATSYQDNANSEASTGKTAVKSVAPGEKKSNPILITMCIAMTALCWGAYGPVLHKGQAKMGGSRLRPFLCVGLAYFAIAVVVPYFLLMSPTFQEAGGWNMGGTFWSMLAGTVGAVGALGIIYAFNFGGKPVFVMPLVFGFAPVINTFTETISKNLIGQVTYPFWISLLLVILGAVTVLTCAPKGGPPTAAKDPLKDKVTDPFDDADSETAT